MTLLRAYWKRFVGLATDLGDRYRYDIFFRTTCLIIAAQVLSVVVTIGVFWWALHYTQGQLITTISDYIEELINTFPDEPVEDLDSVIDQVKTRGVQIVFLGILVLSILFGILLAYLTLRPARRSLEFQKRFISNVAHELRTPLSIIKTSAQVALLEQSLSPSIKRTFTDTVSELDRISEIINNLLSFNTLIRPERMQFSNVDLGPIIDSVVKTFTPLARKREIEIITKKNDYRIVYGNGGALEQIISNLVKNAINYTPKGKQGVVTISAEPNYRGAIVLSVEDTGIGIPQRELFHILEPFYRGDTSRARGVGSGTSGLGLAIVNEIVRLHHGKIYIQSVVNHGTKISIILPCGIEEPMSKNKSDITGGKPANEITFDFSKGL